MAFNLFAAAADQAKTGALVEFKAGRMTMGEGKMVTADKRKGTVLLKQTEDGLMRFVWQERPSGNIEIDLIIFPEDAVFRKVKEANARVYLLQFKTSSKREFFWMQDLSDEKDEQHCNNLNKYITDPPVPGSGGGLGGLGDFNLNQEQLLALLNQGPAGIRALQAAHARRPQQTAAERPTSSSSATSATRAAALDHIRNILPQATAVAPQPERVQLTDVANSEDIVKSGLFEHEDVVKKLAEFLPEGPVTVENMKENIRSPQFQQAVSLFNAALRSGDLGGIMTSFGLDASAIGPNSTIEDFLMAIQNQAKKAKDEDEKK